MKITSYYQDDMTFIEIVDNDNKCTLSTMSEDGDTITEIVELTGVVSPDDDAYTIDTLMFARIIGATTFDEIKAIVTA